MHGHRSEEKTHPSFDIYTSTPGKIPGVGGSVSAPTPSPQVWSIDKSKGANIKKKISFGRKTCQPRRITFVEGDESLRNFPPNLYTVLQQWCARNKTNAIPIAKTNWGRKGGNKGLYSNEGRAALFVSAADLTEVPAARYTYGSRQQLMVVRHEGATYLVLSIQGHACEVTHEDGSLWTAIPWYAWEIDQGDQIPHPSKARFFRLTRRITDDVKDNAKAAEQIKSYAPPQLLPTSTQTLVSGKRRREVDDRAPSTVRALNFKDDSDDEPLAKRLSRYRPSSQTLTLPTHPAISTPSSGSLDLVTSPSTPSPTQFFVFKREITDLQPLRKPVSVITSVKILFKHAEVAGIITDDDTMLMVFPLHGTHVALIRDDHDEFKRLQRIISEKTERSITKILVLPE